MKFIKQLFSSPKKALIGLGNILLFSFSFFFLLDLCFPPPPPKPYSRMVFSSDTTLLAAYLSTDDKWRMKTHVEDVSPELITALLAKEDKWFYSHPGVNPIALGRAAFNNIVRGKRTSGASTITMQVARLLHPRKRNYLSKVTEIFRAIQLEWKYGKKEILEMYLSYLPYGGNVEGVNAAAYIYFQRPPSRLSLSQSILLTIIPNRPNSLRPDRFQGECLNARNSWIQRFRAEKVFDEKLLRQAEEEPVNTQRYEIPLIAPHFSRMVFEHSSKEKIFTSLVLPMQHTAERLLINHVNRVKGKGVSNGSVLVLDNRNHQVLAYCGSADYYDTTSAGQVNGVSALRSPGSTLKPFLYAQAMDKGIVTPKTIIYDIPTNFKNYSPENYDMTFRGAVTIETALRNSLNIPAVEILSRTGMNPFADMMGECGFEDIKTRKDKLGLSVILGGCGSTLTELCAAFSTFPNAGTYSPCTFEKNKPDKKYERKIFSAESAWLISEILSGIERPDLPNDYLDMTNKSKIAWKTGTSFGRRDAWAIGYTPDFTIGVWMGNFDGTGVPDLSGATMAVPLLFDLFNALEKPNPTPWFLQPPGISEREVCRESGAPATPVCRHSTNDFYIRASSDRSDCALEKPLFLSPDSSIRFCMQCLPETGFVEVRYPVYEPAYTLWMENEHISYTKPPPHNPNCSANLSGTGPRIKSPQADTEYLVEKNAGQEILLLAASDPTTTVHYWYLDDQFFKAVSPGEKIFFKPTRKKHKITCMDDRGAKDEIEIVVKEY